MALSCNLVDHKRGCGTKFKMDPRNIKRLPILRPSTFVLDSNGCLIYLRDADNLFYVQVFIIFKLSSLRPGLVTHQATLYLGFLSMKRLRQGHS